ncbi:hypothetical protein B0H19DRAFT_1157014 [Mycena capillaripes]|nr:hypothetical protein B0H19DRAFT_1157014 [Mycena capillaripes]
MQITKCRISALKFEYHVECGPNATYIHTPKYACLQSSHPLYSMSGDQQIIIMLGAQRTGKAIEKAAKMSNSSKRLTFIDFYFPKRFLFFHLSRREPTVQQMDDYVNKQLQKKKKNGTVGQVAAIIFAHSNKRGEYTGFPFNLDTEFLGLKGQALFRKLVVVPSSPSEILQRNWSNLRNAGMRVVEFKGRSDSAVQLVEELLGERVHSPGPQTTGNSNPPAPYKSRRSEIGSKVQATEVVAGRHPTQAIVLLLGHTGQGKSKTINRLLGQNLLEVGRGTLGSTTKVIRRGYCPTPSLAFDDTPGFEDTTYDDRDINASLMRKYRERYFHGNNRIYPNIILLVVSWATITPDADNDPDHFTSAAGKTMQSLSSSGLVDSDRSNVIVVVTKSLSSWKQYNSFSKADAKDKDRQWNIDADRRRTIITNIQRKVFPRLPPWQITFIENGGGSDMRATYPILPNREFSHQNLLNAIRKLIEHPGPLGTRDVAGIHALDILSEAKPLDPAYDLKAEILLSRKDVVGPPVASADTQRRIQELSNLYLGVTLNPISGTFGRKSILKLDSSTILTRDGPASQTTAFVREEQKTITDRLGIDFDAPNLASLSTYPTTSSANHLFSTSHAHLYAAQYVKVVKAIPSPLQLSQEMLNIISRLPPWSEASKPRYIQFFSNHGTHVVSAVALGGTLRVTLPDVSEVINQRPAKGRITVPKNKAKGPQSTPDISIVREGGGSAAAELVGLLQNHFKQLPSRSNPLDWPSDELRIQWTKVLDREPTFCPDSPCTQYKWLYTLDGLTSEQREDLRQAAHFFLGSRCNSPDLSAKAPYCAQRKNRSRRFGAKNLSIPRRQLVF